MTRSFLTAEWRKLIMANYMVDAELLKPHLPAKTILDNWNGNVCASLVGFMFKNVRVKGLRIPFHINFPEVNLRFYVRYFENDQWKRGVVFIREIVPKPAITIIANRLFRERYMTLPMKYNWRDDGASMNIDYCWKKDGRWNILGVCCGQTKVSLQKASMEEFITEHFWGYSRINPLTTGEYEVAHPRWDLYPVSNYNVDCDFGALYGDEFAFLTGKVPDSVFIAEGSPVTVFQKRVL